MYNEILKNRKEAASLLSKKTGHPHNKEFAIGTISMDSMIIDEHPDVSDDYVEKEVVRVRLPTF